MAGSRHRRLSLTRGRGPILPQTEGRMAGLEALAGKTVCLDANIIIYLLEGFKSCDAALSRLLKAIEDRDIACVTSKMTAAVVLVRPFKTGASEQIKTYHGAFPDQTASPKATIER